MAQESGTLQDRFDTTVAGLAAGGGRFLLAVSGGVDSMTMARLFQDSDPAIRFSVAHVNFSLRGEESEGDQRLVEQWCSDHGVEFFVRRVDTAGYAHEKGVSIEMAARELRYSWFAELCSEYGFSYVAVAHNLNDSAETMMLNLLRGTGVRGLCGISFLNGNIVRPMLQFSREEIEGFALFHDVPFRTDSTNCDPSFSRNRIRNEVFPQFRHINPSFLETFRVEAERFSVVEDILASGLSAREGSLFSREGDTLLIDLASLSSDPHAAYWLFRLLHPLGFNSSQLSLLLDRARPPKTVQPCSPGKNASELFLTGKRFESETHMALVDRGFLKVFPKSSTTPESLSVSFTVMDKPQDFDPKLWTKPGRLKLSNAVLFIDADKVSFPLTDRDPQLGDRFRPLGLKGTKLLSDLFTDLKLDMRQKALSRVICDASGSIVCVAPYRIADFCRVTSTTTRLLQITTNFGQSQAAQKCPMARNTSSWTTDRFFPKN